MHDVSSITPGNASNIERSHDSGDVCVPEFRQCVEAIDVIQRAKCFATTTLLDPSPCERLQRLHDAIVRRKRRRRADGA